MAEETGKPVRTLRLKFKVPVQRLSGEAGVSTAGRDATLAATTSRALGNLQPGEIKALAQKHKQILEGYVEPCASPSRIVSFLKHGPVSVPEALLPCWDRSLDVPSSSAVVADRSIKRMKSEWSGSEQGTRPELLNMAMAASKQELHSEEAKLKGLCEEHGHGVHPPGSSGSDQATTTAFHLPCSPAGHEYTELQPSELGWRQQGQALPGSTGIQNTRQDDAPQRLHADTAVEVPGTSAQAGIGRVLPCTFLGPMGAAAQPFCSFTPFALRMPLASASLPDQITDATVSKTIHAASACKHMGDKMRGSAQAPWRVGSLSKYVEASLKYMEACEYMQRLPRNTERVTRMASLYGQTADLLMHASKQVECHMRGSPLGKQALRVLCDRLAAVCYMREANSTQNSTRLYHDSASRVTHLLQRHAVSLSQHAGGAGGHSRPAPAAEPKQQQPSPEDSAVSSQGPAASTNAPTGAPHHQHHQHRPPLPQQQQLQASIAAELGQVQPKLLAAAQKISRYMDLVRRSTAGFQELVDWPEVQSNELAKLACMHMAATFANGGMGDGLQLIAHAKEAIVHIKVL